MRSPLPDLATLEQELRRSWPGSPIRNLWADHAGWTNLMIDADHRWMIRVPRWESSARSMGFEVRFLGFLSQHTTVRVPCPRIIGTLAKPEGWPFFAYPKLPGQPLKGLTQLTENGRARLGDFLKRLFSDLDRCPTPALLEIGAEPGEPEVFAERFERLRKRCQRIGEKHLPVSLRLSVYLTLDRIVNTLQNSRYRPVLIHGDLWPSHMLWNPRTGRATAVIDWEDARLGDPAADLTAFSDLGEEILVKVGEQRRQPGDTLFWERLTLYREILPLWGYLFGLEAKNMAIARRHLLELRSTLRVA